jgi:MFS family permease
MTVLAGALLAPALPDMTVAFQDVPNAEFLVRLTLTMPALFIAIGAPFAGMLLDRVGRKPVIAFSLVLYGISGTSGFFADSLLVILIGRAFLGLSVAGVMSGFTTLIVDYFKGVRLNQFLGYQGAFIGLGGAAFLVLAGFLANIGWRFPFLVHLSAFLVLPGVLFAIDEPPRFKAKIESEDRKAAFPIRPFIIIYSITFLSMAIFFVIPLQLPFYLTAVAGSTSSQVGIALAAQTLLAVFTALLYHRIRARLSFPSIAALVLLALGLNHIIISATQSYTIILIALVIGGLGLGVLPPNLGAWVATTAPPAMSGRAMGGFTTFLFVGQFFTPIFSQPLITQLGFSGAFVTMGVGAILLAIIILGFVAYIRLR